MAIKNKKFSVSEFQTWLDGIMEFQESGWSPTPEQWKSIYQKIQNLKEPVLTPRKVSIDDDSRSEMVDEILQSIPDISGVDFELMSNVLNAILNQMRQGATVTPPQPHQQQPQQVNPNTLAPTAAVPGNDLANLSLSELKRQQGHDNVNMGQSSDQRILESDEAMDSYV